MSYELLVADSSIYAISAYVTAIAAKLGIKAKRKK